MQLFAYLGGILSVGGQRQVLGISFLGGFGILQLFLGFTQPKPGIAVAVVPLGGLGKPHGRGPVLARLEVEVPDLQFFLGLKRVERVFFHRQRCVFFRGRRLLARCGRLGALLLQLAGLILCVDERHESHEQRRNPA